MSSIVELLFTAVGTEAAAGAVEKVNDKLGEMTRELGFLAVGALSAEKAIEGVKGAMEETVAFKQLSLRIGETIQNTVILDQAFRNAGLGGEMIGMSANMLQRALGGLNDMGGRTDTAFRRLGTSIEELKPLEFSQQLEVLSEGFGKLANQSDRVAAARQLFGRSGGSMLQLLGDPEALKQAAEQAGSLATRTEANAEAFHHLEVKLNGIKASLREMYLAAAEQLLPTLESIAHALKDMDLSGVGAFMGAAVPTLVGAGIATKLVSGLDNAVLDWATRAGSPIGQAFAGEFLAPFTGALSTAIPVALAGAITVFIVSGILAAMEDQRVKDIMAKAQGTNSNVMPFLERIEKAKTDEEWAKIKADIQAKIDELKTSKTARSTKLEKEAYDHRSRSRDGTYIAHSAASDIQLTIYQKSITELQGVLDRTMQSAATAARVFGDNQLKAIKESLAPLVAQMPELEKLHAKLLEKDLSPSEQIDDLSATRDAAIAKRDNAPAGLSPEELQAWRIKYDNERLQAELALTDAVKKEAEANKLITDEVFKQSLLEMEIEQMKAANAGDEKRAAQIKREIEAAREQHDLQGKDLELVRQLEAERDKADAKAQAQKSVKTAIEAEKRRLEQSISDIREQITDLAGDHSKTDAEKWAKRKELLQAEVTKL